MSFPFEEFKRVIKGFEDRGIEYYVFGGFALEGIEEKFRNVHYDLDVVLCEEEKEIVEFFNGIGYETFSVRNMYEHKDGI
jgi:hypothetical protein